MGKYDQIFKTIFSDRDILIQFIEHFIPELYNLGIKPENIKQKNIEFADVKYMVLKKLIYSLK